MNNNASDENKLVTQTQSITKAQLINDVQRWVLADTQLKQLNEKVKQMREVKVFYQEQKMMITGNLQKNKHYNNNCCLKRNKCTDKRQCL